MRHWVRAVLDEATDGSGGHTPETHRDLRRIISLIEDREFYSFRTPVLEDLANEIVECTDLEALSKLMWSVAVQCGMQHATIFVLRQGDGVAFRTRISTSYPLEWVERYQTKSYQFQDPVVAHAQTCDTAFSFHDLSTDNPMTEAFWEDAEAHGVGRNGLCQAFSFSSGTRIGVSFAYSRSADAFRQTLALNATDALCLAQIGAEAFVYLARISQPSNPSLSAAELRFLHLLVTGDDPQDALSVTPGYGSNKSLQASIRSKLGVKTILQAVALASANRWFDDLPYDVQDVAHATPDEHGREDRPSGDPEEPGLHAPFASERRG